MLTNYDAGAVAEVMGIAFLRRPAALPSAGRDGTPRLDDGPVVVVAAQADFGNGDAAPASATLIEQAVERGLPRHALRHVAEWLVGGDKAKASALEWGVVPKTTLERRETQLSPLESERTERVARLFVHARRALGTDAEARAFMTEPHPELDQRSPVDAARTDLGARRAEQLLNALEYGLAL